MNEVIQRELASMNRDLVSIMARWRRINDLFLDFTEDRPRPRQTRDINLTVTAQPEPNHERIGECFCSPEMKHG